MLAQAVRLADDPVREGRLESSSMYQQYLQVVLETSSSETNKWLNFNPACTIAADAQAARLADGPVREGRLEMSPVYTKFRAISQRVAADVALIRRHPKYVCAVRTNPDLYSLSILQPRIPLPGMPSQTPSLNPKFRAISQRVAADVALIRRHPKCVRAHTSQSQLWTLNPLVDLYLPLGTSHDGCMLRTCAKLRLANFHMFQGHQPEGRRGRGADATPPQVCALTLTLT
eukprot:TRINITY_DN4399_c0_g2_i1.p1 TRINITY_DN4399_c0_g2~~TRINITY_DN4399_c0_g2_i1.p1  ORF type:complete len:230 (+),score=10.45 TRINITY_DN4399_c0_g2_i1:232-921(+)